MGENGDEEAAGEGGGGNNLDPNRMYYTKKINRNKESKTIRYNIMLLVILVGFCYNK